MARHQAQYAEVTADYPVSIAEAQEAVRLACVSIAQSDLARAQAHVEQILSHLESDTLDGTDEPFRVYLTCYRVLQASRDSRSQGVLNMAHSLLQEQAGKIADEEVRRSFLENVAAHREILSEHAKGE